MNITLKCPEGFTYISWQRIVCINDTKDNISEDIAWRINRKEPDHPIFWCRWHDEPCLFVLSGESFSLEDFAQVVSDIYPNATFTLIDGTQPPENWP